MDRMPSHSDFFWKWLENVACASADVSHFASFSPELSLRAKLRVPCLPSFASASIRIKECLEVHSLMLNGLIRVPGEIENKNDKEVLVSIFEEMMEFRSAMRLNGFWIINKDTLIALSKKLFSRRSEVARLLYRHVWKDSNDDMSDTYPGAVNLGHGKVKEIIKGKKGNTISNGGILPEKPIIASVEGHPVGIFPPRDGEKPPRELRDGDKILNSIEWRFRVGNRSYRPIGTYGLTYRLRP
ncbi:hypothetical protein A2U01_0013867, partial [Trifolium medium]|nr:hypothetical protein [Trifolium medium]